METIANWLWQGIALALAATMLIRSSKRISATTRYRLWWVTLAIVLCLPVAPIIAMFVRTALGLEYPGALSPVSAPPFSAGDEVISHTLTIPELPRPLLAMAAIVWGAWVFLWSVHLTMAVRHLRRARSRVRPFPSARAARLASWLALRDRGRRCTLAVSEAVGSAAVLGPSAPIIAISPRVLTELTDEELDRVVIHEWAHVQRRDDLVRFIQVAVRAIAGLHPAVWWIDRQLHLEREAACDDWAVNLTGSARGYAACLTKLAAIRINALDSLLVPTAIASSDLAKRVMRLLDTRRSRSLSQRLLATSLLGASLGAVAMAVTTVGLTVETRMAAAAEQQHERLPSMLVRNATSAQLPGVIVDDTNLTRIADRRTQPAVQAEPHDQSIPTSTTGEEAANAQKQPPAPGSVFAAPPAKDAASAQQAPEPVPHVAIATADLVPGIRIEVPDPAKPQDPSRPATPWGAAADAGVGIGRGSQKAAVATAGFFSKLGKSIARSF